MEAMDTLTRPADEDRPDLAPEPSDAASPESGSVSRRALLRAAGGGLVRVGGDARGGWWARGRRRGGVRARGGQPPDVDVPAGQLERSGPVCGPEWIGRGPFAFRLSGALDGSGVAVDEPRPFGVTVGVRSADGPRRQRTSRGRALSRRRRGVDGEPRQCAPRV